MSMTTRCVRFIGALPARETSIRVKATAVCEHEAQHLAGASEADARRAEFAFFQSGPTDSLAAKSCAGESSQPATDERSPRLAWKGSIEVLAKQLQSLPHRTSLLGAHAPERRGQPNSRTGLELTHIPAHLVGDSDPRAASVTRIRSSVDEASRRESVDDP